MDPADPAFQTPTKFIGPAYEEAEARQLAAEQGCAIALDGSAYRRVVPSPRPQRIVELPAIRLLLQAGVLVVCAGGGGIPITVSPAGCWHGVEAVIDKDLAAVLLAQELKADRLLLLTDVPAVYLDWDTAQAQPLSQVTPAELRQHRFPPGSMGPKIEAVCQFVEQTGGQASIGCLADAADLLAGRRGTQIVPNP